MRATTGETKRAPFSDGGRRPSGCGAVAAPRARGGASALGRRRRLGPLAPTAARLGAGGRLARGGAAPRRRRRRCLGRARSARRRSAPPSGAITAIFVPDVDGLALLDEDLLHDAGGGARHLGVDLVGRDLEERLVGLDGLALGLEPLRDRALGDGDAHLGHDDVDERAGGHPSSTRRSSRMPGDDVVDLREERLLERGRERHRRVGRGDAP